MKRLKRLLNLLIIIFMASCSKLEIDPDCYPNRQVILEVEQAQGRTTYFQDLKAWAIRYHVPGTIDSYMTGFVCNFPSSLETEGLSLSFSGKFIDDHDKIRPSKVFGGEEFYFLWLEEYTLNE